MSLRLTIIYLLLLLITITTGTMLLTRLDETINRNVTEFLRHFLQKYDNFHVNFHVDRTSAYMIDVLINISNNRTVQIYNYDLLNEDFVVIRPEVPQILNLLFTKNESYWLEKRRMKITYNDVVLFIVDDQYVKSKIIDTRQSVLKLAGKILLLEIKDDVINLYKICYYCGNLSKKFIPIQTQLIEYNEMLLDDFQDLNGHVLNLIFLKYYPYIYCEPNYTIDLKELKLLKMCLKFGGIESHMMRLVSKKMNFKYIAYVIEENISIYDMLKFVNSSRIDIGFGAISLSLDRIPLIQYTNQYCAEDYILMYRSTMSFWQIFDQFLEPFQAYRAWILFLLAFASLSVVLYLILKFNSNNNNYNRKSVFDCFWVLYHMPFEQPVPYLSSIFQGLPNAGLVLALWWWCCLMFGTTYKSLLLSALVHPSSSEPETLAQLVMVHYQIEANAQSTDLVTGLFDVNDPYYIKARQNIAFGKNICEVYKHVLMDRVAMLDERSTVQYGIGRACPDINTKTKRHLRIARKPLNSIGHAWATQIGAPYRQAIDHYLGLILSGGLFVKWTRDDALSWEPEPIILSRDKEHGQKSATSLQLQSFQPLAVIYSSGIGLSIISLILERFYFKYKQTMLYETYSYIS